MHGPALGDMIGDRIPELAITVTGVHEGPVRPAPLPGPAAASRMVDNRRMRHRQTMRDNLAEIMPPDPDGRILHAIDNPIHKTGGLTILRGSLVPAGAVVKVST